MNLLKKCKTVKDSTHENSSTLLNTLKSFFIVSIVNNLPAG